MVNSTQSNQPRWPGRILKWLCRPHYLEEIEGDLQEAYADRLKKHRPFIAKFLFVKDVVGFLRPTLIRKPFTSSHINYTDLFLNHFKISLRVFSKNKLFSLINIAGLTIGISAYLLIIQYVRFEFSYDKHHPRINDLYRVIMIWDIGSDKFDAAATNYPAVALTMKSDFPEVENFTRVVDKTVIWGEKFVLSYTKKSGVVVKSNIHDDKMFVVDSSIFDLFHIPLIRGNPKTALRDPMSIVLSASMAHRFFGNVDPLGKTLMVNNDQPLKVTGVFYDLPQNTHLHFDMLVSFSTMGNWLDNTWAWPDFYNYVKLRPGTDPKELEAKFPAFTKKYLTEMMDEYGFEAKFGLQPVKDIHLKSHFHREVSVNNSDQTLYFLIIIAIFIIIIALVNFINLSTAKSTERAREVGLRKIAGSSKGALIWQFLMESLMINFVSVAMAIVLVSVLMDYFNDLVGLNILSLTLWTKPDTWSTLLVIFLSGGLLAGIYPALILASFKPIYLSKGKFLQTGRGAVLREILVVTQFAVSIGLIAGTFVLYNQFSFMQNKELGYNAKHSLIVNAPQVVDSDITSKIEVFRNELLQISGVNAVTVSNAIPGKRIVWSNASRKLNEENEQSVECHQITVDHDFLNTYGIKLLAGRNFTPEDRTSYFKKENGKAHRILLNEAAAKRLGYLQVEKVINEKIIFSLFTKDRVATVIGVVDNYHQQSLQNNLDPIMFIYPDAYLGTYLTLNINTANTKEIIEAVEKKYDNFFPHDPYNYFFLDEYFDRQYQADLQFGQICLWFSGLAIFIAVLGLFGLGSYMALQKTKEISIRKVLGATITQVLILIPVNLMKLILISGLIALPITYFVTGKWLEGYAYKVEVNVWMFLLPLFMVTLVAFISVFFQSLRAASVNPADSLRSE